MHPTRTIRRARYSMCLAVAVLAFASTFAACDSDSETPNGPPGSSTDGSASADGSTSQDSTASGDVTLSDGATSDGSDASRQDASDATSDGEIADADAGVDAADAAVEPDFYVDAVNGLDTNDGGANAPFRTITQALLAIGDAGVVIKVLPGTYDDVHGETFPIRPPPGSTLMGDESARGRTDAGDTFIFGGALTASFKAAVFPGAGARISGLRIEGSDGGAFAIATVVDITVSNNTFSGGYGGVGVSKGNVTVVDSTFATTSFGVYALDGTATVERNDFKNISTPVSVVGSSFVRNNTIQGTGALGVATGSGAARIEDNIFTGTSYSSGAISVSGTATPIIRSNVILAVGGAAVYAVDNSAPDLGTALDPGDNTLGSGAIRGYRHRSPLAVSAIGNTWAHSPPTCGPDIFRDTDAGVVTFATSGSTTTCP